MKVKIEVTYHIEEQSYIPPIYVDKAIIKLMKQIGAKWYARGLDENTLERNLVFDLELEEK